MLSYRMMGPAHAPCVVFLHGFMGRGDDWSEVATLLGSYRCMLIDLPGHGESVRITPEGFQEAIKQLDAVCQIERIEQAHWVGYSMGARIAMLFWAQRRQAVLSLALESGHPGLENETDRYQRLHGDETLALRFQTEGLSSILEEWYRMPLFATLQTRPVLLESMVTRRSQNDVRMLARSLTAFSLGNQPSQWEALAESSTPLLYIAGSEDHKYCGIARRVHSICPAATMAIMQGCSHSAHREEPQSFSQLLREFLDRNSHTPAAKVGNLASRNGEGGVTRRGCSPAFPN